MIKQQVMEDIIWQAIALGVTRRAAVRPTAIKPAVGCDPDRTRSVFDKIGDESPLPVLAWHVNINWHERETPAACVQPVEAFQRPAPERAVAPFEQDGDG